MSNHTSQLSVTDLNLLKNYPGIKQPHVLKITIFLINVSMLLLLLLHDPHWISIGMRWRGLCVAMGTTLYFSVDLLKAKYSQRKGRLRLI